jgi:hypothetical protein
MANKKLPKAQWGKIVKGAGTLGKIIVGAAKGASKGGKAAYNTATKVKGTSRLQTAATKTTTTLKKPVGRPKGTGNVQEIQEITVKGSKAKTKVSTGKSKARLATENVVGKVVGGAPFYTVNALKKFLKSKYGIGIGMGAATYGVASRWNKTNAPKKAKKFKEK